MDFRVKPNIRERLWAHCNELTEIVLDAGGRFYFAKDSTLTAEQTARMFPAENLRRFAEIKRKCDPDGWLQSDLARRVWPGLFAS